MLGSFNMIHRSAELALQLGRECDVTGQHDMTCDSVTHNVTHNSDL